ncbi:ABC transporter2C ATP-binding/permease protein [Corallococcus coralloides DSM 2259]|uniref:ABC transporter2C ATP-binding/permease protein n=1 Tax=Corallococcus coralloides (strain ATCC 25202 / DSM 2259 / NBRC 100086 / M2) TaxID=1144275 RepID=H8MG46_CORCM|nr:ABC transporter ATP-binding protein [Corallococcus coralloides]AFE09492.1 ABC transporter2C ATP-binding/permease protein [Corallococcus coralloides DSM 2259]
MTAAPPGPSTARVARWIIAHVWRNRAYVLAFVGMATLGNLLVVAIPWLTGAAFDEVLSAGTDRSRIGVLVLAILGAVLLRGAASLVASGAMEVLAQRLERDARAEFYGVLLHKNLVFHQRQRVGDLMARTTDDVRLLDPMMSPGMAHLFNAFACILLSLFFIGRIEPELLVAPLLFTGGLLVGTRLHARRFNPIASALRRQNGLLNAEVVEALSGIELTKWSGQEEQEARRIQLQAERCRDLMISQGAAQARYLPPLFLGLCLTLAFLHGALRASQGALSVGSFVAYMGLMTTFRGPTQLLLSAVTVIQEGFAGARRVLTVLDEEATGEDKAAGHRARIRGELVFDQVSFSHGGRPILKNVSFRAAPGETVAIVGQAGAGKSTLARLINRTYDVEGGRILIDGCDVRDWALDSLRTGIAVVEQEILLLSDTLHANIGFGLEQQDPHPIQEAARLAQAHGFITGFREGYDTVIGERGVTLSGGQRQRVALARALAVDPAVLILDDATSAVDSATEEQIQRAMREGSRGRTTVLITHRLSQIRRADRIVLLMGGEVHDQGTHDELLGRCDIYRRIFNTSAPREAPALAAGGGGA